MNRERPCYPPTTDCTAGKLDDVAAIRLICCHSGIAKKAGELSIAKQLANATGKKVIAPTGLIEYRRVLLREATENRGQSWLMRQRITERGGKPGRWVMEVPD